MNFMKTFWAALLAFIVANILVFILLVMVFASFASLLDDPVPTVKNNSVLVLDISNSISDSPSTAPAASVGLGGISFGKPNTVLQVVTAIESAAQDNNIKGIYINLQGGSVSLANIEEIRNALLEFRDSGKFIVSYGDYYTQMGYYLASVADGVFLNPEGTIDWKGMSSRSLFFKGLLDKLGVDVEILRHGTFKSAVEPFMLDRMSPESRLQTSVMLGSIWEGILYDISMSRGIEPAILSNYATELTIRSANDAVRYGLADGVMYEDQVMELINGLIEGGEQVVPAMMADAAETSPDMKKKADREKINKISLSDYIAVGWTMGDRSSKNKIALLYADGDIVDGKSSEGSVGGASLSEKLARARKDDNVKAVVLRVNSPGGSALASEVIWREMELIKDVKPLVVSMGGYAASGGYYIACPADMILADRSTITGSIGVFGLMVDASKALRDKVGITVESVNTNPSADLGSPFRKLTPNEREAVMEGVEQVYTTFVGHVAEGRNMTFDAVDRIGEGRVWSGANALENGLIDGFGGLRDAILLAADRAGVVENFRVSQIVDEPESLISMIRMLSARIKTPHSELGEMFIQYRTLMNMLNGPAIQARLPYTYELY